MPFSRTKSLTPSMISLHMRNVVDDYLVDLVAKAYFHRDFYLTVYRNMKFTQKIIMHKTNKLPNNVFESS